MKKQAIFLSAAKGLSLALRRYKVVAFNSKRKRYLSHQKSPSASE